MGVRWAPRSRSASGSGASLCSRRWAATPSAPATIRTLPEFFDLCDRMGFPGDGRGLRRMARAKISPDYGYHRYFDEWAARDLADMIARDRNHPSIVIWSAGNEVPDQDVPRGVETLRALMQILHDNDPTRLVTVACDQIVAEPRGALPEFLAELDVVGYNYVGRWRDRREKFYSIDRHDFPQRRFIGTENGAMPSFIPAERLLPAPVSSHVQPAHRGRAVAAIHPGLRLRQRRLHVDRHRLPRRGALAVQVVALRRHRYLRLCQGRLLLLQEHLDQDSRAAPLSALELGRKRRRDHSRISASPTATRSNSS
jgi:hypothetical protein